MRNVYKIVVLKPQKNGLRGRSRYKWEHSTEICFTKIGCGTDWGQDLVAGSSEQIDEPLDSMEEG
jgi:hypothetical protein